MSLSLRDKAKLWTATLLVKLGKLKFDDFTKSELSPLLNSHLPHDFEIPIPIGNADVIIIDGELSLSSTTNRIGLQLLASLNINVMANRLYRAHIAVTASATPHYCVHTKTLSIKAVSVDALSLVNDDYALLKDTQFLLDKLIPSPVSSLLGGAVFGDNLITNNVISKGIKSAVNTVSGGASDHIINYLKLYLKGSKQAILDFHALQISQHIVESINNLDPNYTMGTTAWREILFSRYGTNVRVEDNVLRFYL